MKDIGQSGIIVSDGVHIEDILTMRCGDYKFYPIGVGIHDTVLDNSHSAEMTHRILNELKKDGVSVSNISVNNQQLFLDAEYRD